MKRILVSIVIGLLSAGIIVGIVVGMTSMLLYFQPTPTQTLIMMFVVLFVMIGARAYFDEDHKA